MLEGWHGEPGHQSGLARAWFENGVYVGWGFMVCPGGPGISSELAGEGNAMLTLASGVRKVYFEGDLEAGLALTGEIAGRIDAVKPVAEIISEMVEEFQQVVADSPAILEIINIFYDTEALPENDMLQVPRGREVRRTRLCKVDVWAAK